MKNMGIAWLAVLVMVASMGLRAEALAHCDTMDGPVIEAAQKALETDSDSQKGPSHEPGERLH